MLRPLVTFNCIRSSLSIFISFSPQKSLNTPTYHPLPSIPPLPSSLNLKTHQALQSLLSFAPSSPPVTMSLTSHPLVRHPVPCLVTRPHKCLFLLDCSLLGLPVPGLRVTKSSVVYSCAQATDCIGKEGLYNCRDWWHCKSMSSDPSWAFNTSHQSSSLSLATLFLFP